MYTSLILSSLLPLAAFATPIIKPDGASIVDCIAKIETCIADLNNTLNTFTPDCLTGITTVLSIQGKTIDVANAISSAAATANASCVLNSTDSATLATAVLGLQPQLYSLLDNLVAHKPAFDTLILDIGSVSPQVEADLQQQKALSAELGTAITAKLDSTYAAFAPTIVGQIDCAFDEAIGNFSTNGGALFALPVLPDLSSFESALNGAVAEHSSSISL